MKTITWGATGTYTTLKAAWDATTIDQDTLFQQVGNSNEAMGSAQNICTQKAQGGFNVIVRGGLNYTVSCGQYVGAFYFISATATGNISFEYLNIITGSYSNPFIFTPITGPTVSQTYTLTIAKCKMTFGSGTAIGVLMGTPTNNTNSRIPYKVHIYQNHFKINFAVTSLIALYAASTLSGDTYIYENNIIDCGSTARAVTWHGSTGNGPTPIIRNNLMINCGATCYNIPSGGGWVAGTLITNFSTTASNDLTIAGATSNVNIPNNDVTTFLSLDPSNSLFMVPRLTSALTTEASVVTSIPQNVLGLNGYIITTRVGGAYTTPIMIDPPVGVTVEHLGDGVHISWTPTVQAGNEHTYLYWETTNFDSAFVDSKAVVPIATTSYVITYSVLTASPVWYLRLTHGI